MLIDGRNRRETGQIAYRGFNYMCKILIWKGEKRKEGKEERKERREEKERSGANMAKFYYMTESDDRYIIFCYIIFHTFLYV